MKKQFLCLALLAASCVANAQDFLMQAWGWNYPNQVNGQRYIQFLNDRVQAMKAAGITHLWLPPLSAGSAGANSMGYDVKDYYDLGQFTTTRWGTRSQLNALRANADAAGMQLVADMVYNHRDGGSLEPNAAVKGWIENMTYQKIQNGDAPFPSDRFLCHLPLGGTSGNGAGTYYIKIKSASGHPNFNNKRYVFQAFTTLTAGSGTDINEVEPNNSNGSFQVVNLGDRVTSYVDASGAIDEFSVTIAANQFNAAGDKLYIRFYNQNSTGGGANLGDMGDQYIYGIWNGAEVQPQVVYQTKTNFTAMPSGRGGMTAANFRPNGSPTSLNGDQDGMWFFYDVDQDVQSTRDTLFDFTDWLWDDVGIRGYRVDAVKHFPASFMSNLINHLQSSNRTPSLVVGELYDGNPNLLKNWVNDVKGGMTGAALSAVTPRAFDFSLRSTLKSVCDWGGNAPDLYNSGMVDAAGTSGFDAVTFLNNHDFRGGGTGDPIDNFIPGYAYILTNNQIGLPCIFLDDYLHDNLSRAKINALMACHKQYIYGATSVDYLNRYNTPYTGNYSSGSQNRSLIYQLKGAVSGRDVIVAINFGSSNLTVSHTINGTNIPVGTVFTDIFANSGQATTTVSSGYAVDLNVAPNDFGIWVQGDLTNQIIPIDTSAMAVGLNEPNTPTESTNPMSIFPNPNKGNFTLLFDAPQSGEASLELLNLNGQILRSNPLNLNTGLNALPLDMPSDLPAGLYLVQVRFNGQVYTQKAVKI